MPFFCDSKIEVGMASRLWVMATCIILIATYMLYIKGITMNTFKAGTDPEELMILSKAL